MAMLMQQKLDKCWESCSLVLIFGLIFYNRHKLDFVKYAYREIYGDSAEHYIE